MKTPDHQAVAVQPEHRLVAGHVPDKQLAVGQCVLRDGPRLHEVWHLNMAETPAHRPQAVPGGNVQLTRLCHNEPGVGPVNFLIFFACDITDASRREGQSTMYQNKTFIC